MINIVNAAIEVKRSSKEIGSSLEADIEIYLKDTGSPALIKDPADFDSIYVVMPMKG